MSTPVDLSTCGPLISHDEAFERLSRVYRLHRMDVTVLFGSVIKFADEPKAYYFRERDMPKARAKLLKWKADDERRRKRTARELIG